MSIPIKLGSAAGTFLIFETGSKIMTSTSGIQSCSIKAVYGDGQNIFSKIPTAGTPFNEVFGNAYLPSDFKVDLTGGGYDIEYIEGKAARVTLNFKRPDPTQPGQGGQRARKVSVTSEIKYQSLVSSYVIGYAAGQVFSGSAGSTNDESSLRFGFPDPVVTVTYNQDAQPTIAQITRTLRIQGGDPRAAGFPDTPTIDAPGSIRIPKGGTVFYLDQQTGEEVTQVATQNSTYTEITTFGPNDLGWQLTGFKWESHADDSFFDVTETWRQFYGITGGRVVGVRPGW